MYLWYGQYRHNLREATLRIEQTNEHSEIGFRTAIRLRFLIDGLLVGSTRAELLSQVAELQNAYSYDRGDIRLTYEDGAVAEHYRSDQSISGILVKTAPNSVGESGAERAVQFRYSIQLEANYFPDSLGSTFVTQFSSGLRKQGTGGSGWELVPQKSGTWKKQDTTGQTPVRLTQFGELTGLRQYPRQAVPGPMYPNDLVPEGYQYEEVQAASGQQTQFTIRYSYEFLRSGPF